MSFNTVKIIQDSINTSGNRLTTFEIETYRYIWAEVLTHKMLNKNAQSSRAVPVASVLTINAENPVEPIVWGMNKGGMSASEVLEGKDLEKAKVIWKKAAQDAFDSSKALSDIGLHKMWANRITEPYSRIKVVMSGTEWDNFLWLRDDPEAAQPEIVDLARKLKQQINVNKPTLIFKGELHVPYVDRHRDTYGEMLYFISHTVNQISSDDAMKISASCSGQVSYRKLNDTYEKAMEIYGRLFSGPKPHLSPTEHQGVAMSRTSASILQRVFPSTLEKGVSHIDRDGNLWSANLKGFLQHRKIMEQTKVE